MARKRLLAHYTLPFAAVGVSVILRLLITWIAGPGLPTYITYYPAVMLVALISGFGPGLLATLLSVLTVDYLFVSPGEFFRYEQPIDLVGIVLFISMGAFMSWFGGRYRTTMNNLETIVAERTRALKESEARLIRSQEIAHLGSWELDLASGTLTWSDEVYRIFGLNPGEFRATYQAFLDTVHPEDRAAVDEAYSASLREGNDAYEIEHRVIRKSDGSVRFVYEKCEHVRDASGAAVRSVGIVHDITERKKAEEEIRKVNENLEQFAYVASHDLQEPLRTMASYSQLLDKRYKNTLDKDAADFIGFIVDAASRMQKLITDLLAYSRAGHKAAGISDVDCEKIVRRVAELAEASRPESAGRVTFGPLPTIRGHEASIMQLFQNLIGNAFKFRGNEPPAVRVEAEHSGREWIFSVHDNGIGIEPQYRERIFQIFQRLHPRERYEGTGIGLSICKRIVENHGGRIWVESGQDRGSNFYFTIPAEIN